MALGNPTRALILDRLRRGPATVGEIAERVPVTRAAVSQHLKLLKAAGLVTDWAKGRRHYFQVDARGLLDLRSWLDGFEREGQSAEASKTKRSSGLRKRAA